MMTFFPLKIAPIALKDQMKISTNKAFENTIKNKINSFAFCFVKITLLYSKISTGEIMRKSKANDPINLKIMKHTMNNLFMVQY